MNDTLEILSDTELNEVFAVEVAYGPRCGKCTRYHDANGESVAELTFSTSADAVLPWLELANMQIDHWPGSGVGDDFDVSIYDANRERLLGMATHKSFARAACLALIRAKRAQEAAR